MSEIVGPSNRPVVASAGLGRLQAVDLRQIWKHEAAGFTAWLAEKQNLALLGETLGLTLELEAQEREVGPFRADLLCKDTGREHWVLIENQLERTDHTHLGQLITYSAGLQAATIVWISARFTDEHRAALDWLNEITGDNYNFFGVEVELWRIGDSLAAPKFNVVSRPNDWSKSVQEGVRAVGLSPSREMQLAFWSEFRTFLKEQSSRIRAPKPQPQNWMPHPIGRSGFLLCSIASTWDSESDSSGGELRVEMVVNHKEAKAFFGRLETDRESINRELGVPVVWHNPAESRQAKIYVRRSTDLEDRKAWPEYFGWLEKHLRLFMRVFEGRVRKLEPLTPSDDRG